MPHRQAAAQRAAPRRPQRRLVARRRRRRRGERRGEVVRLPGGEGGGRERKRPSGVTGRGKRFKRMCGQREEGSADRRSKTPSVVGGLGPRARADATARDSEESRVAREHSNPPRRVPFRLSRHHRRGRHRPKSMFWHVCVCVPPGRSRRRDAARAPLRSASRAARSAPLRLSRRALRSAPPLALDASNHRHLVVAARVAHAIGEDERRLLRGRDALRCPRVRGGGRPLDVVLRLTNKNFSFTRRCEEANS